MRSSLLCRLCHPARRTRSSSVVRNTSTAPCSALAKCSASNVPKPSRSRATARSPAAACGTTQLLLRKPVERQRHGAAPDLGLRPISISSTVLLTQIALPFTDQAENGLNCFSLVADAGLALVVGQTVQAARIQVELQRQSFCRAAALGNPSRLRPADPMAAIRVKIRSLPCRRPFLYLPPTDQSHLIVFERLPEL